MVEGRPTLGLRKIRLRTVNSMFWGWKGKRTTLGNVNTRSMHLEGRRQRLERASSAFWVWRGRRKRFGYFTTMSFV